MKKTTKKTLAVLSSLALLFAAGMFVSCSDSDDDDSSSTTTTTPSDNPSNVDNVTVKATAKTYSFTGTGVTLENLSGWDMASKDVIGSPIAKDGSSTVLASGATVYYKSSKAGTVRFRSTHTANAELTADMVSAITALNFNGGQTSDDFSSGVTLANLDRYVSIPVDGAGTVTASIKFVKSSGATADKKGQAALVDSNGKLIGTLAECDMTAGGEATLTGTVSAATTVTLAFSRNGAGAGGMDVTSIEVKPAE